jgi:hypothetical protein
MKNFTTLDLSEFYNASKLDPYPAKGNKPYWDMNTIEELSKISLHEIDPVLVPFQFPLNANGKDILVLPAWSDGNQSADPVFIPIGFKAHYCCFAHCCAIQHMDPDPLQIPVGEELAKYTFIYADGSEHQMTIRRRFEIDPLASQWLRPSGGDPFVAKVIRYKPITKELPEIPWGIRQMGIGGDFGAQPCIYAMPNPYPEKEVKGLRLQSLKEYGIAIFAITLAHFPEHPLQLLARETFLLSLPEGMKVVPEQISITLDRGYITRMYAEPGIKGETWLKDPLKGLGKAVSPQEPQERFAVEATGTTAALFKVTVADKKFELSYGEAVSKGKYVSPEGARIEFCYLGKTWTHVKVVDEEKGKPTPVRIRFLGPRGEYLPPYGHPADVNTGWFEDEGGNVVIGSETFAYVPGEFQIELPVGDVFVEISKGFEYEPMRRKLNIKAGTRQLTLGIKQFINLRQQNFVTADTHVHFLSPQTAWLEGQCEGLNLINLLASKWGKLFTNVGDITGKVSGSSEQDTIVFVGTENRHHLLGHISLLGTKGMPAFPMCTGGPTESWFGDPDIRSQLDWAEECRAKGGVVIRPHFPNPNCEVGADIILGKIDALEIRNLGVRKNSLDSFSIRDWYRYLNCGYRLPAVGGTDKMCAGTPLGGVRTYAQLDSDDELSFENWGKAVKAGRTFTTSGPLIGLTVEGNEMGEEIQLPVGGGTLDVEAWAVCAQPMHGLELINNGKIISRVDSKEGSSRFEIKEKVKIDQSGWLAARCFSQHQVWHIWPTSLNPVNVGAHTSPVYVVVDNQEVFSPSDAVYIMTLLHGGMEWVDTLSIRGSQEDHHRLHAVFENAERELKRRWK